MDEEAYNKYRRWTDKAGIMKGTSGCVTLVSLFSNNYTMAGIGFTAYVIADLFERASKTNLIKILKDGLEEKLNK